MYKDIHGFLIAKRVFRTAIKTKIVNLLFKFTNIFLKEKLHVPKPSWQVFHLYLGIYIAIVKKAIGRVIER